MTDITGLSAKNRATLMAKLNRLSEKSDSLSVDDIRQNGQPRLNNDAFGLFANAMKKHAAELIEVNTLDQLPGAVNAWLDEHRLAKRIYSGNNPQLATLPWQAAGLEMRNDFFTEDGQTSIATADCGIAETGTVVLTSGNQNPTANNFLARIQFVVLSRSTLFTYSEEAWHYLKATYNPLPRAINFISGPSSSGDVGLKIEFGAHGPKTLVIILTP